MLVPSLAGSFTQGGLYWVTVNTMALPPGSITYNWDGTIVIDIYMDDQVTMSVSRLIRIDRNVRATLLLISRAI